MTIIVTRAGKGSPLTNNEMDANLNNLNTQGGTITTVASATTPDIFAVSVGRVVDYTGTATATGFVAAPQAGLEKELICAGAAVFTAGANFIIAGTASASNYTAVAGDRLLIVAETTTKFRMYVLKASGAPNFAAGTVAAPAIYLSTDTGTGLYRIGANNDGFAINGTKLLDLSAALVGITGAATVSTTLGVTGATTLSSTLAAGNTTITGSLLAGNGSFRQGSVNAEQVAGTTSTSSFLTTTSSNWVLGLLNNSTTPYGLGIAHNTDSNGTGNDFLYCTGAGTLRCSVRSNGGLANVQANNANVSDARLKKNIELAGNYLDKICAIPVKTYLYKDQTDEFLNLGVIAQDVEAVAPELIDSGGFGETPEDGTPLKAIYQTDLQYALMKAIQELAAKVAKLEEA